MERPLPILALIGAGLAFLGSFLFSGEGYWLLPILLGLVTAVYLYIEGGRLATILASALIPLSLIGLFTITRISIRTLPTDALFENLGPAYALGVGLLAAGAALATRWERLYPTYVAWIGAATLLIAYVLLYIPPSDSIGTLTEGLNALPAVAALLAITPGMALLREAVAPEPSA